MTSPALTLPHALLLLRAVVALVFMAHAVVRVVNGSMGQFAAFLEAQGFAPGLVWVWMISACEIVAGLLLLLGVRIAAASMGLLLIVLGGIVLIHARIGWFVGEHGTGGMEFSWLLVAALLVLAAADRERAKARA